MWEPSRQKTESRVKIMLAKVFILFAVLLALCLAAESVAIDDGAVKGKKPCQRAIPCRSSSSSSSLCPRRRGCGCPSSSHACAPVFCPRRKPASSTSELPTAGSDSSSRIECPCCLSSSHDACGFLLAGNDPRFLDRRCECNPCACNPCAGRQTDPCDCN